MRNYVIIFINIQIRKSESVFCTCENFVKPSTCSFRRVHPPQSQRVFESKICQGYSTTPTNKWLIITVTLKTNINGKNRVHKIHYYNSIWFSEKILTKGTSKFTSLTPVYKVYQNSELYHLTIWILMQTYLPHVTVQCHGFLFEAPHGPCPRPLLG